jgi:hypothetical protein
MSRKAHRAAAVPKPEVVVRSLLEIVEIADSLVGPYKVLYREVYDSGGSASEVRISGGGEADPVVNLLDSRDHQKLHAFALAIARHVEEARRELGNAASEIERSVGRSFKQPPHMDKGYVDGEDFKLSVQRRRDRMSAGGEMERVQESGR